jgi:hypothetical protein
MAAAGTPKCYGHIGFSFCPIAGQERQQQIFNLSNGIGISGVAPDIVCHGGVLATERA